MVANLIVILFGLFCVVNASVISINIYDGDNKLSQSHPVKDCDNIGCDQSCRRIGFPGGICVGGRCKCDIMRNELTGNNKLPGGHSVETCDNIDCDQSCRRIGFPSGICVDGRCKCDILSNEVPKVLGFMKTLKTSLPVQDCDFSSCYQMCITIGFDSGICVGDNCECGNLKPKRDVPNKLLSCDIVKCDDMCHRLNYAGGTCNGGSCECY